LHIYGFGYLKQRLFKSKAKTLAGLWKVTRNIWKKITQHQVKKAFDS
jgi:hypothetical protein